MSVTDDQEQAMRPEPDRLEGFPRPREIPDFFGHARAERALLEACASGRLPHAWLLAGPEGVGKATLAYRFARFVLARQEAGADNGADDLAVPEDHPVFGRVAALSHPGLAVLRRPWQEDAKRLASAIPVAEVRHLQRFLGHTAGGGQWRIVVIDRADELNPAAVNALLKSLEEPPPACLFLLIAAAPGRLPVTIRSRCRMLRLAPMTELPLEQAVMAAHARAGLETPETGRMKTVLPLAEGSVARALRLLAGDGAELYRRMMDLIADLPRLDHRALHKLADELAVPGAETSYNLFFALLGEALARMVSHAATGSGAAGEEEAKAARLIDPRALAQWAELWETIHRAKAEADTLNLDRKNLVLGTFFRLEEAARPASR